MPLLLPLHLVANERPLINIDATLFINIGLWILLFVALRGLLWNPMIKLITAREGGMQGSRDTAHTLDRETKVLRAQYETAQKTARKSAMDAREKIRSSARAKEAEIVEAARIQTQSAMDVQRADLRAQHVVLQTELRATVPMLANDIASKVLGREVRS